MSVSESSLQCPKCGTVFVDKSTDTPQEERTPCPKCGSTDRAIRVGVTDSADILDIIKVKARHGEPEKVKPYLESKSGKETFRKTGRIHRVEQVIDRENDKYYKHVVDDETGRVIKHQEEPLNQHIPDQQKRNGSGKQ